MLITVAATLHRRYRERAARISDQLPGYGRKVGEQWVVCLGDERHPVTVRSLDGGGHEVLYGDERYRVLSDWQFGQHIFRGTVNGNPVCIQVERRDLKFRLFHWGSQVDVTVLSARAAELLALMPAKQPPDMSKYLLAPMPGLLAQVRVVVGDEVKAGQDLAVVEAMKMENLLRAERDGKVRKLLAAVGDTLAVEPSQVSRLTNILRDALSIYYFLSPQTGAREESYLAIRVKQRRLF